MNLLEALAWISVELQSSKPDRGAIQTVLQDALVKAMGLEIKHEVTQHNLVRIAQVSGLDAIGGGVPWKI